MSAETVHIVAGAVHIVAETDVAGTVQLSRLLVLLDHNIPLPLIFPLHLIEFLILTLQTTAAILAEIADPSIFAIVTLLEFLGKIIDTGLKCERMQWMQKYLLQRLMQHLAMKPWR